MNNSPASTLIFTWGNPSRGDDALGPQIYELLQDESLTDVDLLTDFQLQIEHAVDLENRQRILFVDASVCAASPFEFYQLNAVQDESYSTHAVSPESLLSVYEKIYKHSAPPAFMLSIRGYQFDLGLPLSVQADMNLSQAIRFIKQLLACDSTDTTESWNNLSKPVTC